MKQPVRLLSGVLLALFFSLETSASERWVVLGGDIAETLSALKADINLVARDDTVLYPEPLTALPSVGYLRQLSAESVCRFSLTASLPISMLALKKCLNSWTLSALRWMWLAHPLR